MISKVAECLDDLRWIVKDGYEDRWDYDESTKAIVLAILGEAYERYLKISEEQNDKTSQI